MTIKWQVGLVNSVEPPRWVELIPTYRNDLILFDVFNSGVSSESFDLSGCEMSNIAVHRLRKSCEG